MTPCVRVGVTKGGISGFDFFYRSSFDRNITANGAIVLILKT